MNDETLILYYYKDGLSDRERQQVETALNSDPAVAARFDALCRELNDLAEPDIPTVPKHTVERWHAAIDDAARSVPSISRPKTPYFRPASLAWGAALAAALVIAINMRPSTVDPVVVEPPAASATFVRGVQVHFRDTYERLSGLAVGSDEERAALVLPIIEQNRMYERAASRNGADDLARVLRAFEPVLARLAAEETSREDAEALRAKLVFELNVMLTKLSSETSKQPGTANSGIKT